MTARFWIRMSCECSREENSDWVLIPRRYAFVALSSNRLATRKVAKYFQDNYSAVRTPCPVAWQRLTPISPQLMKRFGDNFAMSR
jgi:hypothetical protein